MEEKSKKINPKEEFISLLEMGKFTNYSQEYLSLLCRQGKLKGKKIGRNWVTTKEWLEEYYAKIQYNEKTKTGAVKINVKVKKSKIKYFCERLGIFFRKRNFQTPPAYAMPGVFLIAAVLLITALPLLLISGNFSPSKAPRLSDMAEYSLDYSRNAVSANAKKIAQKIILADNSLEIIEKQAGVFADQKISSLRNSAFMLLGENETLKGKFRKAPKFSASIISLSDPLDVISATAKNNISNRIIITDNSINKKTEKFSKSKDIISNSIFSQKNLLAPSIISLSKSLDIIENKSVNFAREKIAGVQNLKNSERFQMRQQISSLNNSLDIISADLKKSKIENSKLVFQKNNQSLNKVKRNLSASIISLSDSLNVINRTAKNNISSRIIIADNFISQKKIKISKPKNLLAPSIISLSKSLDIIENKSVNFASQRIIIADNSINKKTEKFSKSKDIVSNSIFSQKKIGRVAGVSTEKNESSRHSRMSFLNPLRNIWESATDYLSKFFMPKEKVIVQRIEVPLGDRSAEQSDSGGSSESGSNSTALRSTLQNTVLQIQNDIAILRNAIQDKEIITITKTLKGEKGEKGEASQAGPAGSQGEQGLTGPVGEQGIQGPEGPEGTGNVTVVQSSPHNTNTWSGSNVFSGHGIFESLGVSYDISAGRSLGVGGSTTLGSDTNDTLNVYATSNFIGPITSGAWQGTAIATQYGGTGQDWSSSVHGSVPYFSADGAMSTLDPGTSGYYLKTQGSDTDPVWAAISTGVGPHDLLSITHSDTTAGAVARGDLIAGQGATPSWEKLTIGSSGHILRSDGTDIAWSPTTNITELGIITTGTWNGSIIDSLYGGTGANLSAAVQGGVPYFSATGIMSALGSGTAGQALISGGAGAPSWGQAGVNDATYLTLSLNSSLSAERVLTAGTNVSFDTGTADKLIMATIDNPVFSTSVDSPLFISSSGNISFNDENLTTTGTAGFGGTTVDSLNVSSGGITNAGVISGGTTIDASGTITGGTLTDGTFSATGGNITGAGNITFSGSPILKLGTASGTVTFTDADDNTLMTLTDAGTTGNLDIAGTTNTQNLISHNLVLPGDNILTGYEGFNNYLNVNGGIGTGGISRIDNQGNLVNIAKIQGGEMLLTNGGTFAAKVDYATGSHPRSVAIGDVSGDGKADLAVTSSWSEHMVSVFINKGDGTFDTKVDYTTGSGPNSVVIGDVSGDGKADLAVANADSNTVSVFINNGDGTFAAKVDYTTGTDPRSVAMSDVSGDGKADLAVANLDSNTVSVFINNGDGTFAAKVDYTTGTDPRSVAMSDVSGDGKADLAVANFSSNTISVFINNGDGTFVAKVDYATGTYPASVAINDVSGDGKADLAVTNRDSTTISVFINNGDGTFVAKVDYVTGTWPYSVAMGDVSGDGKIDLAVGNYLSNTISVFINNGDGTFAAKVDYTTGTYPRSVAMSDVSGDGKADLVAPNYSSDTVSVLINNDTPMFFADASTGNIGIGVTDPDTALEIYEAGTQLKLSFDGTDNATFAVDTNGDLTIATNGDEIFIDDHLKWTTDNQKDIGASGATRPRTGYFGTSVVIGDTVTIDSDDILASGALTISTTGANNLTLTPGTGLTTTGSTFQITGGLLDVNTYADIAYSGATTALTVTQSDTGAIADFTNTVSATSDAFTLTNLGSGNSFLVEDVASDASPFVIDADGNVGIGTASPLATLDVRGTIENGLVAWWSMDEGTGETTITDQSINSNTGTFGTSPADPTWTNGKFGKALSFDGTDDYVDCGTHSSLNITGEITIEAWFNTSDDSSLMYLLNKLTNEHGYQIYFRTTSPYLRIRVEDSGGTEHDCNVTTKYQDGNWHHLIFTFNGVVMKAYIDGIERGSTDWTGSIGESSTIDLTIGKSSDTFNGQIDEVRIYNRALSAREISESYRQKASSMAQGGTISDNSAFTVLTIQQSSTGNIVDLQGTGLTSGKAISLTNSETAYTGTAIELDIAQDQVDNAFLYDGAAYTDNTTEANSNAGTAYDLLSLEAVSNDELYFSDSATFDTLNFDIIAAGAGVTLAVKYCSAETAGVCDTWTAVSNKSDGTSNFTQDGKITWTDPGSTAWKTCTIDSVSAKWIQMTSTGTNITTAPTAYYSTISMFTGNFAEMKNAGSTKFVIDSDGNMGIGTDTPLSTLDVRGTIENGLVAWWSMDEGTGETTITDQSINSNTGTLGGGTAGYRPTWTNGKFGKALDFDGTDDYVEVADHASLRPTIITLSFWYKRHTEVSGEYIFKNRFLVSQTKGLLIHTVAATDKLKWRLGNGSSVVDIYSNTAISVSEWVLYTCTYDGTTMRMYIDGILQSDSKELGGDIVYVDSGNFYISDATNTVQGQIDEVKIYNRALSAREISESYRQKAPSMAQGGTISDNSAFTALTVTQSGTGAAAEIGDATQNLTVYSDGRTIINYSNFEDISEGSAQSAFTVRPVGFTAVAYEDAGVYTDRTDEAKSTMGTAFTVAETGAGADIFYVGHTEKFYNLTFDLDTVSDGDVSALDMEFSAGGTTWTAITSETDGTAITGSTLKQDGSIQWQDTDVSTWAKEDIDTASADTTSLSYAATDYYWVRMKWTGTASPAVTAYIASLAMGTRMEIYAQSGDTTPTFYINDKGNVAIGTTSISSASSLTVDQIGTGKIVDFKNAGTSAFEVNQAIVKISQPLQINVAGDVGFSRSIEFTSTGASHIFSEGPFTIAAGDPNSSENLTLTTRATEELAETGDVTTGVASYIIDTGQTSWVNDEFVGGRIEITAGPGIGEIREICANAASDDDRITACSNFSITPTTASDYSVYRKAGDILVNIGGTNMTSGGFKVLGMDTNAIFRISPEGDVGIGTMSPSYALDIKSKSTVGTAFFVDGGGAAPDLDDITTGGTFIGATALDYRVKIDSQLGGAGGVDTFTWSDDGGSTWDAVGVDITGSAQDLNNGVTVIFAATTGHDLDDYWNFSTTVTNPFAIQNAAGTRSLSVGNDGNISVSAGVDNSTLLTIQNTDTAIGTAGYLLELIHNANDDADADFLICQDDGAGTPDTVFSIASDGTLFVGGSASIGSGTANSADMGTGAAADLFITDDLEVDGDIYAAAGITGVGSVDFGGGTLEIPNGTALPATCSVGQIFHDTDSNDCANTGSGDGALCICKAVNTWVLISDF